MVLCKYFMNGNCRFGTKCMNEHLDVKQLLKSDVESAVNGNQWPLSCFGPFKEKPSIPNFIEDQSFEEMRRLCYGSKKQNFFESFNQQFNKEVMEAKNKMKMLLSLNKEVMDVVVNLYNSSEPTKGTTQASANPFENSNAQQTNAGLFGAAPATQNSLFGGAAGTPFGGNNATASGGGSIFGGAQKPVLGQSTFGSFSGQQQQPQQQQQSAGLFGSQQPQAQPQQTNAFGGNIFAQAAQQTPVGGGSLFGGLQQQQQQQQPQQNQSQPFGGNNTQAAFGQQPNAGNIFSQAVQQTQQQPAIGGNIFAQPQQQQQQPQQQPPGFGLFSQAPQQAPPPFGAQVTQQSTFNTAQPQQSAFFGQTQQQQQQQQLQMQQQTQQNTANVFNSQMQPTAQQQPPSFQQQQTQQPGLFASAAAASPFGANPQQQNIFAQAQSGYPQQMPQSATASDRTYSKMENLTPEEIEAFKAETFELGKIPFSPPPRELVN